VQNKHHIVSNHQDFGGLLRAWELYGAFIRRWLNPIKLPYDLGQRLYVTYQNHASRVYYCVRRFFHSGCRNNRQYSSH